MNMKIEPAFRKIVDRVVRFMEMDDPGAAASIQGEEFAVGRDLAFNERGTPTREYRVPGHAVDPIMVGDAAHISDEPIASAAVRALFKQDPAKVLRYPKWNGQKGKYDILYRSKAGGVADAAPDLIGAQLLAAPGLVGYFEQLFRKPLLYFKARDLVKIFQGSSPWASVMSLYAADYAGGAVLEATGSPEGNGNEDVNAQSMLMTSPVINMSVSYSLSVEELERAKGGTMPFGAQLIDSKRSYSDYALELLFNALIYFGNVDSETLGLLGVDTVETYQGKSAEAISLDGTNTAKGSAIYQALAKEISDFLTRSFNKFNRVRIAVSPGYYNLLGWVPYSDVYNPDAPRVQILKNFMAGETKDGRTPDIEIFPDPLLAPGTPFNTHEFDIMVITAPEINAGPEEIAQPIVLAGAPLMRFVYPTIPGQYMTNYKILRRYAGVFAPVKAGVHVVEGIGFQPTDT